MADVRVTCIIKPNPQSPHEHITHVGNPPTWVWSREDVIKSINEKTNTFYVLDPVSGMRANIGVFSAEGRLPYLRTYADGKWNNNLLSLTQCPYC